MGKTAKRRLTASLRTYRIVLRGDRKRRSCQVRRRLAMADALHEPQPRLVRVPGGAVVLAVPAVLSCGVGLCEPPR